MNQIVSKVQYWLKIEIFPKVFRRFQLDSKLNIGRDKSNDIVLPDPNVSARHAMIELLDNEMVLEDLKSSNGTLVNDQIVTKQTLQNGDFIKIGATTIVFEVDVVDEYVVDYTLGEFISKRDIVQQNDIFFIFHFNQTMIYEALLTKIEQVFDSPIAKKEILSVIEHVIEDAHIRGNMRDVNKLLKCRVCYREYEFSITITSEGNGFHHKNQLSEVSNTSRIDREVWEILAKVDSIEYSENGNEIVLIKKLSLPFFQFFPENHKTKDIIEHTLKKSTDIQTTLVEPTEVIQRKYLMVRYPETIYLQECFCLEIVIASEKLSEFPEDLPNEFDNLQDTALLTPVLPGCICTPPSLNFDSNRASKLNFWVTPITNKKMNLSFLEIKHDNIQKMSLPFSASSKMTNKYFLVTALILCIFLLNTIQPFFTMSYSLYVVIALSIVLVRLYRNPITPPNCVISESIIL